MPLDKIPTKPDNQIRFVTFNVNGVRTLFHYHPWSKLRTLNAVFDSLHADIITLQELKVARKAVDNSVGRLDGYLSFVTVPKTKKGYAGVGVYVRVPKSDEDNAVRKALTVIKAEEGVTGILSSGGVKYRDHDDGIGGYPDVDDTVCEHIDSEGRCVVIELATNTVVISVYCPANSMATDEGEQYRVQFLEALLQRIRNLETMGKQVVLMGDINIARDLIDRADYLSEGFKQKLLMRVEDESEFEAVNKQECIKFIRSSIPRILLNEILVDSIDTTATKTDRARILFDTTRQCVGRKHGVYTVWNTMTNARPGNFGSRIDLILMTEKLALTVKNGDIWPFLQGSDHCPVYTDIEVDQRDTDIPLTKLPRFEARYFYKLSGGTGIHAMFANAKRKATPSPPQTEPEPKKTKTSSQPTFPVKKKPSPVVTPAVTSFFKSRSVPSSQDKVVVEHDIKEAPKPKSAQAVKLSSNGKFTLSNEKIPECKHKEPCILKTARTSENKGKKFWTCARDKGEILTDQDRQKYSCGFFQWR